MMSMCQGGFVWYELMTGDVEAAQAFYAAVVGWRMADSGLPGAQYLLANVGERQVAGMMDLPPGGRSLPMWFGYILVADVDAMVQRVAAAGGTIHRPSADIPGIGRFAVVADPQGAAFMLFHGNGEPPPDLAPGTPGTIGWRELRTTDWTAALAFYQELFGWEASDAHDMGPMGTYQVFSVGGSWEGGMMNSPQANAPHWAYYFTVDDIDAAAARVTAAGGAVLNGPHPVPGGSWVLIATDPQGTSFALTGPQKA